MKYVYISIIDITLFFVGSVRLQASECTVIYRLYVYFIACVAGENP